MWERHGKEDIPEPPFHGQYFCYALAVFDAAVLSLFWSCTPYCMLQLGLFFSFWQAGVLCGPGYYHGRMDGWMRWSSGNESASGQASGIIAIASC